MQDLEFPPLPFSSPFQSPILPSSPLVDGWTGRHTDGQIRILFESKVYSPKMRTVYCISS